ncbi:hypothetical protein PHLCEN_2v12713 [Hermanssonia centrifuga]|uniref:Uncharacterized protein n=1 Tax=Hermanssonia centrifuga TaxID=98765 RepID=A0A2R6NGG5_9APHY|nr:hypothetical protein PHLCEN_2v12713 [Hermanssonia centrifuga]
MASTSTHSEPAAPSPSFLADKYRGAVVEDDKVINYMTKFKRVPTQPYTLITPSTPLAELEQFLQDNIFAIGK